MCAAWSLGAGRVGGGGGGGGGMGLLAEMFCFLAPPAGCSGSANGLRVELACLLPASCLRARHRHSLSRAPCYLQPATCNLQPACQRHVGPTYVPTYLPRLGLGFFAFDLPPCQLRAASLLPPTNVHYSFLLSFHPILPPSPFEACSRRSLSQPARAARFGPKPLRVLLSYQATTFPQDTHASTNDRQTTNKRVEKGQPGSLSPCSHLFILRSSLACK